MEDNIIFSDFGKTKTQLQEYCKINKKRAVIHRGTLLGFMEEERW